MSLVMLEIAYTAESWSALVKKPENRIEAIRPAIEPLGGRIVNAFFAFGEYDSVLICEYPDEISAAAFQIAGQAGGASRAIRSTPLMSVEDGIKAFEKAGSLTLRPPKA